MKFLVAVVLLACASTATAGLFDFKKPEYKPVCKKACKKDYDECKKVEVEEVQCPKPVYKAPEPVHKAPYYGKFAGKYGRKLQNDKQPYVAPTCPKVKVLKEVCEKKPCTVTELVDQTTCQLVCDGAKHGRKLQNSYYTPAPVYVAPKPKCENKCTTVKVPVTKCLDKCVYEECPKPVYHKPAPKPVEHKPKPDEHKPEYDVKDIIGKFVNKLHKEGDK